jgi:hypothetical protein
MYWKQSTLTNLYVRFFDADKVDGKFQPVSVISKSENFRSSKHIVPVIFITNRTFLYIKDSEIDFLAKSIYSLIDKKIKNLDLQTLRKYKLTATGLPAQKMTILNF